MDYFSVFENSWKTVSVDERVPLLVPLSGEDGTSTSKEAIVPLFAQYGEENQFGDQVWVMVLEKFMAKLMGGCYLLFSHRNYFRGVSKNSVNLLSSFF